MGVHRLSNLHRSPEELIRESLRFQLDQTGADPSGFFDALDTAVKLKAWVGLGLPDLAVFIVEDYPRGVGATIANVRSLLTLHHRDELLDPATSQRMADLRATVLDALSPKLLEVGSNQYTEGGRDNITSSQERGTDPVYIVGRLKRDKQKDLADQVVRGEVSANAAAKQAGFRKPYASVRTDDPDKVAAFLAKHFDRADLKTIYDLAVHLREGQ